MKEESSPIRQTWEPAEGAQTIEDGGWAEDGKAGGADNIFTSRLPTPIRVGSMEEPDEHHKRLMRLILSPIANQIKGDLLDDSSELGKSLKFLTDSVSEVASSHEEKANLAAKDIKNMFSQIFPDTDLSIQLNMSRPNINPIDLLTAGSGVIFKEGEHLSSLVQQGTGARRAVFWGLLQVHNNLVKNQQLKDQRIKEIKKLLASENKKKKPAEDLITHLESELIEFQDPEKVVEDQNDVALPGNILLIDEPENALHPGAARAAQEQLFELANDPDWQVILTTHSPYFINPLADHTTIIRLARTPGKDSFHTNLYRASSQNFVGEEIDQLKALMQMDTNVAEMFFGLFPILVEGDTEHAAFYSSIVEPNNDLSNEIIIVRARGKALLAPLARILRHFNVPFSIMHDADTPHNKKGKGNASWTANKNIFNEINLARKAGLHVNHHISFQDFEHWLGLEIVTKDKPFSAYTSIKKNDGQKEVMVNLFNSLCKSENLSPISLDESDKTGDKFLESLKAMALIWAKDNGLENDPRYSGIAPPDD